jgi:hypothetical protein
LGILFSFYSLKTFNNSQSQDYAHYVLLGLKSLIVVGLLLAASKYAFTLGKTYMSDALKNADRIHAISFGRFYLRAYGEKATWPELKEVFQHWNIDRGSPLSSLDTSSFDPKILETISEVSKLLLSQGKK